MLANVRIVRAMIRSVRPIDLRLRIVVRRVVGVAVAAAAIALAEPPLG